uniref:Uncharacterized protein n=1 Tax=Oryza sativa subsp. japonica TaxID=39947 RepID=Q5Z5B3_ORYSJ|nr:hypothetical protein [Oryza sativa Japonica Group]
MKKEKTDRSILDGRREELRTGDHLGQTERFSSHPDEPRWAEDEEEWEGDVLVLVEGDEGKRQEEEEEERRELYAPTTSNAVLLFLLSALLTSASTTI